MGRDWRAQKRASTRGRLSAAAFALFAERGYGAVAVADIAAAAEVSVPTFYSYFRTKEHVVLPDQDLNWIGAHLVSQPADLPLDERIRRGLQAMIAELDEDTLADLLHRWQLVLAVPALRSRSADRVDAAQALIVDALGIDQNSSAGSTDVVVAAACLTAATTAFMRWGAVAGERALPELVDEAFAALRSI